jgi:hypothetical protein
VVAIADHLQGDEAGPLWTVLLTRRQRRLLEVCVAWHARVHEDADQRQEFAALAEVLRLAWPADHASMHRPAPPKRARPSRGNWATRHWRSRRGSLGTQAKPASREDNNHAA